MHGYLEEILGVPDCNHMGGMSVEGDMAAAIRSLQKAFTAFSVMDSVTTSYVADDKVVEAADVIQEFVSNI